MSHHQAIVKLEKLLDVEESMRTLAFCRARRTSKGRLMSEAPEGGGFAVATCMTLDNVAAFLP
jgi:hypothetical protein